MSQVAVIIPCFKQARFLGEAIESALLQTCPPAEVIVVDDDSPDDTAAVVARYSRVKYIRQPNQGVSAARNTGIRATAAKYVVFLDADDRLLPHHLETCLEAFRRRPDVAFVCGDYRWFGAEGTWHVHACDPRPDYYGTLLRFNFIGPPIAVMIRRNVLLQVGGFRRGIESVEDYDLYLRIARTYPIHCHHTVIAEYRRHGTQASRNWATMLHLGMTALRDQRAAVLGNPRYEEAYLAGIRQRRQLYGESVFWQGIRAAKQGRWREAARCWGILLYYHPWGLAGFCLKAAPWPRLVRRYEPGAQEH